MYFSAVNNGAGAQGNIGRVGRSLLGVLGGVSGLLSFGCAGLGGVLLRLFLCCLLGLFGLGGVRSLDKFSGDVAGVGTFIVGIGDLQPAIVLAVQNGDFVALCQHAQRVRRSAGAPAQPDAVIGNGADVRGKGHGT